MIPVTGVLRPSSTASTDEQRLGAVAAPVRDPLWFLARQFQTGGFIADDAGSPVTVRISHTSAPLSVEGRPVTGPLEPDIEAEPPTPVDQVDTATRIRLATELFRRLADAGLDSDAVGTLRANLTTAYPLRPVLANAPSAAIAANLPDAIALYAVWAAAVGPSGGGGTLPAIPGAGPARAAIEPVARGWVAWVSSRVGAAGGSLAPAHWSGTAVAYGFQATASLGGAPVTLQAAGYDGSGLDWDSFDRSALASSPTPGPVSIVRPGPVTYPGMPERGYWTMEEGSVNLEVLAAQDPARQLLAGFARGYGNDWFVVPLQVDAGICAITTLTVTDSFGTVTSIPAAAALDGPGARFRLWELDADPAPADAGAGLRVFLPSSAPSLQGPVIEDVLLARDEMANLGWLVELTTSDQDGRPVDRYRRWLSLRTQGDPTFAPTGQPQYYRLGTTLPDFWYPLESTVVAERSVLELADLPAGATDVSSDGVRGVLLPHSPGTFVEDEEVSRTGTRVTRVDRLTYTATGRRVWRARHRLPGFGEASSGLRFDSVGPPAVAPNRVRNPTLALAARTTADQMVRTSGRVPSEAQDWQVVDSKGGATQARLEPATRSLEGWQLHVTATKARSGVAQQFAAKTRGLKRAQVSAWVYVITGQVALSAGPGGAMKAGALSSTTGEWELLTASASRAPVTQVVVLAQGGPAQFIVDAASVRED